MPQLRTAEQWGFNPAPVGWGASKAFDGFGDAQGANQDSAFASAGINSAGSAAIAAGLIPANLIPFVGPALVGVTLLASYLIKNSGCGQTCIQTSQWANQAADALQKNLDAYRALPTPRHPGAQQVALQNFDAIWTQLEKMCGDPQWGDAGKRCISDRQRGACTWKNNGQCWDWFIGYRDPIANDPDVGTASVLDSAASLLPAGSGSGSLLPLLAIAGLVLVGATL